MTFFKFNFWNWDLLLFFQLTLLNFDFGRILILVIFLIFWVVFLILFIFLINLFEFEAFFRYKAEYFRVLWDLLFNIDLIFYGFIIFVLKVIEIVISSIFLIFDIFNINITVALELIVRFIVYDIDIDFFSGFLFN